MHEFLLGGRTMVRMHRGSWAVSLGLLFGLAAPASAGFVTYTFSGTGTGDLGGTAFTDSPFQVTISGDTADISRSLVDPDTPVLVNLSATIEISGLGVAVFASPVDVFNSQAGGSSDSGTTPSRISRATSGTRDRRCWPATAWIPCSARSPRRRRSSASPPTPTAAACCSSSRARRRFKRVSRLSPSRRPSCWPCRVPR